MADPLKPDAAWADQFWKVFADQSSVRSIQAHLKDVRGVKKVLLLDKKPGVVDIHIGIGFWRFLLIPAGLAAYWRCRETVEEMRPAGVKVRLSLRPSLFVNPKDKRRL